MIAKNRDNNLYDLDHDDDWVEEFEKNMCVPYFFWVLNKRNIFRAGVAEYRDLIDRYLPVLQIAKYPHACIIVKVRAELCDNLGFF